MTFAKKANDTLNYFINSIINFGKAKEEPKEEEEKKDNKDKMEE